MCLDEHGGGPTKPITTFLGRSFVVMQRALEPAFLSPAWVSGLRARHIEFISQTHLSLWGRGASGSKKRR